MTTRTKDDIREEIRLAKSRRETKALCCVDCVLEGNSKGAKERAMQVRELDQRIDELHAELEALD